MESYLKEYNLDPEKFICIFKQQNVNTLDQLESKKEDNEFLQKILEKANVSEKKNLMMLLGMKIDDDISFSLQDLLEEKQLESDYWIPLFAKLNVISPKALEYIDSASYGKLQAHIRHDWEGNALKDLLDISFENLEFESIRRKDRMKMIRRQEDAQNIFKTLEDLKRQGKGLNDRDVKVQIKNICIALDIPEYGLHNDSNDLNKVISSLEILTSQLSLEDIKEEELSQSNVLLHASNGLALSGVLMNKIMEPNHLNNVLATPKSVTFEEPIMKEKLRMHSFISKDKKHKFEKSLRTYGFSVASAVKGGFAVADGNTQESDERKDDQSNKTYYGQVRYTIVPVASYSFDMDDMSLDDSCSEALGNLERICTSTTDETVKQRECVHFFNEFGSHVNIGPIHLGGIYYWKSDYEKSKNVSGEEVKLLNKDAMNTFVNDSYLGGTGVSGTSLKNGDISSVTLNIESTGGPKSSNAFSQWKCGLIANNSTWAVIDRGSNFKGIWEILKIQKTKDKFGNLENILLNAWQKMTGLEPEQYLLNDKSLLEAKEEIEGLLIITKEFIEDKCFAKNCDKFVKKVVDIKLSVFNKTRSNTLWRNTLNQPEIREFLKIVLQHKDSYGLYDIPYIIFYVKEILEEVDDMEFKSDLEQWINDESRCNIEDESSIISFITKVRNKIIPMFLREDTEYEDEDTEEDSLVINATRALINMVKSYIASVNNHHMVSFIKLMLLPLKYDYKNYIFRLNLSAKIVDTFLKALTKENSIFMDYKSRGEIQIEAYLINLAVLKIEDMLVHQESNVDIEAKKQQKFLDILTTINVNIETNIFLKKYTESQIVWKTLTSDLKSRMYGVKIREKDQRISLVEYVINTQFEKSSNNTTVKANCVKSVDQNKMNIINKLGLEDYYPNKLTLTDVRKRPMSVVKNLVDTPWYLLDKIIMMDYRGLNKLKFPVETKSKPNNSSTVQDKLRQIQREERLSKEKLHPIDVLIAVFLCSSNFLKQLLVRKMAMCRLSIPFILSNPYDKCILQLWSLRGVNIERHGKATSVVDHKIPIVSCIRFGNLPRSKSILLNSILHDPTHNTFFNIDCDNGNEERVLSKGLVDASWYIPSIKDKCSCNHEDGCKCFFKELVMFLNLHGSFEKFENQCQFLTQVSNVIIIFIDVEIFNICDIKPMTDLLSASKTFLFVLTKKEQGSDATYSDKFIKLVDSFGEDIPKFEILVDFEGNKRKNLGDIKADIISNINMLLNSFKDKPKSLQELIKNNNFEIATDEDDQLCKQGKQRADKVIKTLGKIDTKDAKKKLLLLQGSLWKDWGHAEKKGKRMPPKGQSRERYCSHLYEERKKLREKQIEISNSPNELMKSFSLYLLRLKEQDRNYFIQWLQYSLDKRSQDIIPPIRTSYSKKWSEIQNRKKNKKDQDEYTDQLQLELNRLGKDLEEASLGWEHLLREIGQIYEANKELEDKDETTLKNRTDIFPEIMAKLLLCGYPIEIMDGNASHVPITWVQAVFKQLENLIGNKKIFVLSVLGIQSSGKSTLLNAMFGLEFSVSAGRCTQGVFAQLVPLPEKYSLKHGFYYIMVVDTEGLRAPELALKVHQHDNELATLAVGIADLTIINIKGENQSEMMSDVLQIVIHAFLRMKIANNNLQIKSSCFFTHQNVGADTDQIKFGQTKFLETLDVIAAAAADEEGICDVNYFSDVIAFNVEKDIFSFSNLWQGDPPMAPVNCGYSETVNLVKQRILYDVIPHVKQGLTISKISTRLSQLWDGIMADDFVFSFKNSLEIKAFNTLETTYSNLTWQLKDAGYKWFNIKAKMELSNSNINLSNLRSKLEIEFSTYINNEYNEVNNKLEEYFSESDDAEILEQWKGNKKLSLSELKNTIINRINGLIHVEIEAKKIQAMLSEQFRTLKDGISKETTDLAKTLQTKTLSQEEINDYFDHLWTKHLTQFRNTHGETWERLDLGRSVIDTVESVLCELCHAESALLTKELELHQLKLPVQSLYNDFEITKEHIQIKLTKWALRPKSSSSEFRNATTETHRIFRRIKKFLDSITDKMFTRDPAENILKLFIQFIDSWNSNEKNPFKFLSAYKVSVLVHTCRFGIPKFEEMYESYKKKIDPSEREETYKQQLKKKFINIYRRSAIEKTYADVVSMYLEKLLKSKVDDDLPRTLANDVRSNHPFMHTKRTLQTEVLSQFVNERKFESFMLYIKDTATTLKEQLRNYTNSYLFIENSFLGTKYFSLVKPKIDSEFKMIINKIKDMPTEFINTDGIADMNNWVDSFIKEINMYVPVEKEGLQEVTKDKIDDFNYANFHKIIIENLEVALNRLKNDYKMHRSLQTDDDNKVNIQLAESSIGCDAQCPFCKAPCSMTESGHDVDHSAIHHYPQGVAGCRRSISKNW